MTNAERDLRKLAAEMGYTVRAVSRLIRGRYCAFHDPDQKTIRLYREWLKGPQELLYVLAHELGHAISHRDATEAERSLLATAWAALMAGNQTAEQAAIILTEEEVACRHGETLLMRLSVKMTPKMLERYREQNLRGYRRLLLR